MGKNVYQLFILIVIFATSNSQPTRQYRTDYEYNAQTNAFYKLHTEEMSQRKAVKTCKAEGGLLLIPNSELDVSQVHGMMKRFPAINFVFIGDDGQKHESAEEQPLIDLSGNDDAEVNSNSCDVISKAGDINVVSCMRERPSVCKVDAREAIYDDQCKVYGGNYTYKSEVGSCYKVPDVALNWDAAYADCDAQGAHLVVINSDQEHRVIKQFLATAPAVNGARTSYFFFAGIRAQRGDRTFRTIFNQTLEAAGFNSWSDNEPNNYHDSEYCGTVFSNNGKYNDVNCLDNYAFICEKEVHI